MAVANNLDTLFRQLKAGTPMYRLSFGWLHKEPMGIRAITEGGHGPFLKPTRLYIFVVESMMIVYNISIGDKQSQQKDIQYSINFVKGLKKNG